MTALLDDDVGNEQTPITLFGHETNVKEVITLVKYAVSTRFCDTAKRCARIMRVEIEELFAESLCCVIEAGRRIRETEAQLSTVVVNYTHFAMQNYSRLRKHRPFRVVNVLPDGLAKDIPPQSDTGLLTFAYANVTANQAHVLRLRFEAAMTIREVAETIGISLPAAKRRSYQALKTLRSLKELFN